jgi:hypothetical protein
LYVCDATTCWRMLWMRLRASTGEGVRGRWYYQGLPASAHAHPVHTSCFCIGMRQCSMCAP